MSDEQKKKVILVVDDDAQVRKSVATFIRFGGYNTIEADSPTQALTMLSQADGIVTDNNMLGPDSDDGLNLSKDARTAGFKGPIIAISGQFPQTFEPPPEYGIDAAFGKPISPAVLNKSLELAFKKREVPLEPSENVPAALRLARQEHPETHGDRAEKDDGKGSTPVVG